MSPTTSLTTTVINKPLIIRASIIGASGYTGIELIRLLNSHPQVRLSHLISETYHDQEISQVFPHLKNVVKANFTSLNITEIAKMSDVVFLAMPHTKAATLAGELLNHGCKVIDLSADLRLNDAAEYERWYQHPGADPLLLNQAVYGLAELGLRKQIANANLIANPGCYPTATLLGLAPLIANRALDLTAGPVIVDAKSGVSGAGRGLSLATHFCETMNNFSAYQVAGLHRHIPEIEQELTKLANEPVVIQFTPHLIPSPRGLMATIYGKLNKPLNLEQLTSLYHEYYQDSYFVRIDNRQDRPGIKAVVGSNFCNLNLHIDPRTNYAVIVSTIDNLIKGASGQAVQNMNLMYNIAESTGLDATGIYP